MAFDPGHTKLGGRPKGGQNKATAAREAEIRASGLTPLEWMLKVMRDESADPIRRDGAAKDAAPYVHPRLAAIEHSGPGGGPVVLRLDDTDTKA